MVKEYKYVNTEKYMYSLDKKPLIIWGEIGLSVNALSTA